MILVTNPFTALVRPVQPPAWRGPVREFHLLDREPVVAQPDIGREPWEENKYRKRGRPRLWRAWTLIVPGVNDPTRCEQWPWKVLQA